MSHKTFKIREIIPSDVEDDELAPIDSDRDAASFDDPTDEDDDSEAWYFVFYDKKGE